MRIPTEKTLSNRLRIDSSKAKAIRKALGHCKDGEPIEFALNRVSEILGFHGVEPLIAASEDDVEVFLYANSGETYRETVVYDPLVQGFVVCSIGSLVESSSLRFL